MRLKLSGTRSCRFTKGLILALAVFAPARALFAQPTNAILPPAPRRVNFIVILADHLATSDLGCYGGSNAKTPNIDQMASEGARFTSFYAGSAADAPSRATLLTGNDTGHLDIRGDAPGASLSDDDFTIAQYLKTVGYHNGMIGKWALATHDSPGDPRYKGFDEFAGFLTSDEAENDYSDYIWRYDPNPVQGTFDGKMELSQNADGKQSTSMADLFTTAAMNFVHNNKPKKFLHWRAFFLLLSYAVPHPAGINHQDAISDLDENIGKLMQKLTAQRVESNTVVIFTSVNSRPPEISATNGLTEAALRAPLIVWYPPRVKPAVVNEPWAAWDLFPTIAELARMDAPTNIDGVSFKTLLFTGAQTNLPASFYWEVHGDSVQQAARLDNWKAIRPHPGAPIELFDLQADPGEKQDVAAYHPDVVARIEACFKSARTESDRWPLKEFPPNQR